MLFYFYFLFLVTLKWSLMFKFQIVDEDQVKNVEATKFKTLSLSVPIHVLFSSYPDESCRVSNVLYHFI